MTTMNNAEFLDLTNAGNIAGREGFWSRIVRRIGLMFGRTWEYMNEDMGPIDASDDYYPMGDCCL